MTSTFREDLRVRKELIERAHRVKLPLQARISLGLIVLSVLLLAIGNRLLKRLERVAPDLAASVTPEFLQGAAVVAAIPGLVGLILSFYTVARYPDSWSRVGGTLQVLPARRWLWYMLGGLCYLIAVILTAGALTDDTLSLRTALALGYAAVIFAFLGYLLTFFRAVKHPAVASLLFLTVGIGILLFPLYIPSLIIGSARYRRLSRSPSPEDREDTGDVSPMSTIPESEESTET